MIFAVNREMAAFLAHNITHFGSEMTNSKRRQRPKVTIKLCRHFNLSAFFVAYDNAEDAVVRFVPIRLTHSPTTCGVLPFPWIEFIESRCADIASNAEKGAEGVEWVEAPVKAERELIEIGLKMLMADPWWMPLSHVFRLAKTRWMIGR